MGTKSKGFALVLVALFLTSLVTLESAIVKAQTRTLVVPDQYPTIQSAVSNASAEDTVFVKKGTYLIANLKINKPIQLIGEDPSNTILDGDWERNRGESLNTIVISSSNVRISGFNITNFYQGIATRSTNKILGITLSGNTIANNGHSGIMLGVNSSAILSFLSPPGKHMMRHRK